MFAVIVHLHTAQLKASIQQMMRGRSVKEILYVGAGLNAQRNAAVTALGCMPALNRTEKSNVAFKVCHVEQVVKELTFTERWASCSC